MNEGLLLKVYWMRVRILGACIISTQICVSCASDRCMVTRSIKNKHGETVLDLLSPDDPLRAVIRKSQAQATLANDDIASGELTWCYRDAVVTLTRLLR